MTRARAGAVGATLLIMLAGCASVPKDAGFADVRRTVIEQTRQPVEWTPAQPITAPDDAATAALLQEELTADRAVQIAFANNRDLQATLEGLGLARADLIAASTIRNPFVEGELRFPGSPAKPFELVLAQPLIDLVQLGGRKKLGRAQFEAARLRITGAVVNFAGEVRTHYYDVLASRRLLARQDALMRAQEVATDLARRQHDAGNVTDLDLENEQSRYEQAKLDHARAQLEELQARERLTADLGLVNRAALKLPEDFPAVPESEMTAEEVEAQATARRLDIQMTRSEIEAAQRAIGVAKGAAFEDLSVGAHHEREPDGTKTTGPAATVPIPIFDRGAAPKARARALLRQAQQRLAALTVTGRSEARAAQERLLEARARMTYLREVVIPRRERILKLSQLEYNAMLRGVFQLIQARQELSNAQRDEVMATRDYWVARTDLEMTLLGVASFSVRSETREEPRPARFTSRPAAGAQH